MSNDSQKRPAGLLVICLYAGTTALSIPLTVIVFVLFPPGTVQGFFAGMGALGFVNFFGEVAFIIANLLGALYLFRLRRAAVQPFGWALALVASLTMIQLASDIAEANRTAAFDSNFIIRFLGLAIGIAIFVYARRLRERGVLT